MYDVVIIGAGVAGITAAIFSARREAKTLIISNNIGGQLSNILEIENWPGDKLISGAELASKLQDHLNQYPVEIKFLNIEKIVKDGGNFSILTANEIINSKSIILAYGKSPSKLNIADEEKFVGRGVSYCVNCDGQFFKNKIVAVIGGGSSALEAALTLSNIGKKVYLIHRRDSFRAEDVLINKVQNIDNIELILNDEIANILGENKVSKIKLKTGRQIDCDGIFVEIGYVADSTMVKDLVEVDDKNLIIIKADQSTSTPGVFAAGDITNLLFNQLIIASGQGAAAALSAVRYLQRRK